jgi:CAI-1 autoinducer synthase
VAETTGCIFVVDESHSLGTHGRQGEGLVASLGLSSKVHFRTASLAKAFAGRGGVILGDARVMEYFRYEARPAIFSSAVLPYDTAGFMAALNVIKTEGWRREKVQSNANQLRAGLKLLGYNMEDSKSQIISLESGVEQQTMVLRDALESRGVFGAVFCAPATPKNRSLIRFSMSANMTPEQIDTILQVCADIREEVGMRNWASTRRLARQVKRIPEENTIRFGHAPNNVIVFPKAVLDARV